jgi:hypothetical protein
MARAEKLSAYGNARSALLAAIPIAEGLWRTANPSAKTQVEIGKAACLEQCPDVDAPDEANRRKRTPEI